MPRRRISLLQENRIWALRCQGYSYASIAAITGVAAGSLTKVLRRVRRRPAPERDPLRRGRRRAFLNDYQIAEIRRRRRVAAEPLAALAPDYGLSPGAIGRIARGRTYARPETDRPARAGAPFANRLLTSRPSLFFRSAS